MPPGISKKIICKKIQQKLSTEQNKTEKKKNEISQEKHLPSFLLKFENEEKEKKKVSV